MFAAWGRLVYRFRWVCLSISGLLLVGSLLALRAGGTFSNFSPPSLEYARAIKLMQNELPHQGGSSFELIFRSDSMTVQDPAFKEAMLAALTPLRADPRVSGVVTPYDPAATTGALASRDGHAALAIVSVRDDFATARAYFPQLRALVRPEHLQVLATSGLALASDFDRYLQADLHRAETVSLPLALLLLLLVFATVVAALLPLGVGGLAVVGGLAGVGLLARITDVSTYATNIVTLIGLGVAIDYSLFIVNRFREELGRGRGVEESLSIAMATSGRAVTFSGLTVAIGLSGMLFFQGSFLASMGLAGAVVVGIAVVYALTFLASLLAILGPRVNRFAVPLPRRRTERGLWHAIAIRVMRHPIIVLLPVLAIMALLASPFTQLRLANGDVNLLPPSAESHRGSDLLSQQFPGQNLNYLSVVVRYATGSPLTPSRVGDLYDYASRLQSLTDVTRVESVVTPNGLNRSQTVALVSGPASAQPATMRDLIHQSVGPSIVVLSVVTAQPAESDRARAIVNAIRQLPPPAGGEALVTGQTAYDIDLIAYIVQRIPWAVAWVMLMTYVVLFLLVGSVVLPLKAVIMNVVSISASFGALVWIFQQGHLSHLLNFSPSSIDPSVPVLLFCIIFGLSMDYEVLLLSRIQEEYRRGATTREAVAEGLERSGRLITGAAAIMVAVFAAFGLADVVLIKSIGLGLAIAVVLDATRVRALVVPAVMRLLGEANWWSPRILARLHGRLGLGEGATRPLRPTPLTRS
ncbi:MAG TPA: MMPL family transporter [Candidatus Limnocylindrales bacterium]|nr:MMPL family transporter [Candidatus Limnocylindrales bacterium]